MNTSKEQATDIGIKQGRPAHLGEKVSLWLILVMIVYLVIAQ